MFKIYLEHFHISCFLVLATCIRTCFHCHFISPYATCSLHVVDHFIDRPLIHHGFTNPPIFPSTILIIHLCMIRRKQRMECTRERRGIDPMNLFQRKKRIKIMFYSCWRKQKWKKETWKIPLHLLLHVVHYIEHTSQFSR